MSSFHGPLRAASKRLSKSAYPLFDLWDHSDRLLELARLKASQWQKRETLETRQLWRLNEILRHAYQHVPYYRSRGALPRPFIDLQELSSLPILTKQDVRNAGTRLLADQFSPDTLLQAKTGGSTGTSLKVYFDHRCQQHRNAAAMRSDAWAGWQPGDWTGALWGTPELPKGTKRRLRNWLRDRLEFLDTMRLDSNSMQEFLLRMQKVRYEALFGHAHSLFILADFVLRENISIPPPKAIVSTSMMLLAHERQVIEQAFGCPVTDRYGCEETGLIAAQCERHQGYHVTAEHLIVEIVDASGVACAAGETGRVLLTDLENRGMPLVRYEVGDLSSWAANDCPCGRGLPVLERIVGRQADCLQRTDGSLVAGVSLVERTLLAIAGIRQLQLIQDQPTHVIARLVLDEQAFIAQVAPALVAALGADLGPGINIEVRAAERIAQEKNGKYRFASRQF